MESHLSCQIQLCALLASKREEIFHFLHFSLFSLPVSLSLSSALCYASSCIYPIFLPPFYTPFNSFFFPPLLLRLGVVEGHLCTDSHSQKKEGEKRSGDKDEKSYENSRERGSQAGRLSTLLCTHHFLSQTWLEKLEGHMGLQSVKAGWRHQHWAILHMRPEADLHKLGRLCAFTFWLLISVVSRRETWIAAAQVILSILYCPFIFLVKTWHWYHP